MDSNWIEVKQIDSLLPYILSIDWKDPWLICLIIIHVTTTIVVLLTKNHSSFQMLLFFIMLASVYFSETLNEYAAFNWKAFSRQQYFDSNGLFISLVFSIPILLNCMLIIGAWMYSSTQLLQKMKILQIRQQQRRELSQKLMKNE